MTSIVGSTSRWGGSSHPPMRLSKSSAPARPSSATSVRTTVSGTARASASFRSSKPTTATRRRSSPRALITPTVMRLLAQKIAVGRWRRPSRAVRPRTAQGDAAHRPPQVPTRAGDLHLAHPARRVRHHRPHHRHAPWPQGGRAADVRDRHHRGRRVHGRRARAGRGRPGNGTRERRVRFRRQPRRRPAPRWRG